MKPIIQTERLLLRSFTPHDLNALFQILHDEEANRFLPWFPAQTTGEAERFLQERILRRYTEQSGYFYAICLKSDALPIGYVQMSGDDSHDFGYALRHEFWRRGLVTEACGAVVEQIRDSGIPYITATHDVKNPRSGAVMKKLGMTYRYSYKEAWQPKDILVTFRMYQLNFDGQEDRTYGKYWDTYPIHFVEEILRD